MLAETVGRLTRRRWDGTDPDEPLAALIHHLGVREEQFVLEVLQRRVVELKLPFEGPVSHPTAAL